MKSKLLVLLLTGVIFLTSCIDTIQEVTINPDGSGVVSVASDMSSVVGMMKMMGGESAELDKLKEQAIDTTILMSALLDSAEGLSAEEKRVLSNGKMQIVINFNDEKLVSRNEVPFKSISELALVEKTSSKFAEKGFAEYLSQGKDKAEDMKDMPSMGFARYYTMSYTKNVIERKLDKAMYEKVGEDEGVQAFKEMSGMGINPVSTVVFNLPRPAKKAEGKNVTLSDDKKKVTIKSDMETFLSDGSAAEFRIEY